MSETKHIRTLRSKKLHPEHVKLINEAIRHNARGKEKDLHITYRKENGEESERKVRPLAVKGKSLFVAHCHERNAIRSFRVERIGMVKSAFWDGFEKRALSPELLRRAASKAFKRSHSVQPKPFGKPLGLYDGAGYEKSMARAEKELKRGNKFNSAADRKEYGLAVKADPDFYSAD